MTLLNPFALLWLGSLPALVWLWRLASSHRRTSIPSLIPFEHLLRRSSLRRTRLVTNLLFWLQLACLILLALALSRPALMHRQGDLVLAILDTSASLGAHDGPTPVFDQAKHALLARLAARSPKDRVFVVTTAPVTPVLSQPTSDGSALAQAVRELRVSHLGGNLATAVRVGRSFLAEEPDRTLVVTDEPRPPGSLGAGLEWVTVGRPMPNLALVGLEAQGTLCSAAEARLIATVQNFSPSASRATLVASQEGRRLAETTVELAPSARLAVPLVLPDTVSGLLEVSLSAREDHLDADNRAWVSVRRTASMPMVVRLRHAGAQDTISSWLAACPALQHSAEVPVSPAPYLLITDEERGWTPTPSAVMVFRIAEAAQPILSHWVVSSAHPIGSYLAPVEIVSARLDPSAAMAISGIPVVSGIVNGLKFPIVVAHEQRGRRLVWMLFDPSSNPGSTPVLLAFFNSLRWLMGSSETLTTGEPLVLNGFGAGAVTMYRPDGSTDSVETSAGGLRYEATTLAGRYRASQGGRDLTTAVNFFNPLESNLLERVSTWRDLPSAPVTSSRPQHTTTLPFANVVVLLLLILVLLEWRLYSLKGTSLSDRGSGLSGAALPPERLAQRPEPTTQGVGAR